MVRRNGPTWPDLMIMVDGNGNKMIHPRRTLRSARFDRKITRINHINQKFNWPKVKLKQSDSKPDSSWRISPIFELKRISNWCFRAPRAGVNESRPMIHGPWIMDDANMDCRFALKYHYPSSMIQLFFPICLFQFYNRVTEKLNLKIFSKVCLVKPLKQLLNIVFPVMP